MVKPKTDDRLLDHRWRESVSPIRRVAHCGRHPIALRKDAGPALSSIRLMVRPTGDGAAARFTGLQRCGSVWSCPECAKHLAAARVEVISRAMVAAHAKGYGACWQTLTLPHQSPDRLRDTLALVAETWREISASRPWKALRARLEVLGLFRKIEVTHGVNGWHPHAHVTFISRRPLTEPELEELETLVWREWSAAVELRGFDRPWREFCPIAAINLERPGREWAEYIGKMVGLEFAGTGKGRPGEGRTPFEILDGAVAIAKQCRGNRRQIGAMGDPRLGTLVSPDPRLWWEYQRATKGKHQMHWSRGLKAHLGVAGEALDEEDQLELADALSAEQEEEVCQLTPYEWSQLQLGPERRLVLLAIAEAPAPLRDRQREVRSRLAEWCRVSIHELLPL